MQSLVNRLVNMESQTRDDLIHHMIIYTHNVLNLREKDKDKDVAATVIDCRVELCKEYKLDVTELNGALKIYAESYKKGSSFLDQCYVMKERYELLNEKWE